MKKISLLLISGSFAANFALPVWAEHFTDYVALPPTPKKVRGKLKRMKEKNRMGRLKSLARLTPSTTKKSTDAGGAPGMTLHFPPAS